jgi:hypothetical protein
VPFSIVLLLIDDATPEHLINDLSVALQRASSTLCWEPN